MTIPHCSSGVNFFIIDSDGRYSRCYSGGFARNESMGNIATEDRLRQYSVDEMKCQYDVECNHGCRIGCDFAQTMRFTAEGPTVGSCYNMTLASSPAALPRNEVDIYWHLSRLCNYNCVYCIEPFDKTIDKVRPGEMTAEQTVEVMGKLINQFDRIHLQLTGGEPSRHPAFLDLAQMACFNQDKVHLRILSNFSMVDRMKDVFTMPWRPGNLSIWASCHFSERQFDLDRFIELCLMAEKVGKLEVATVDHEHERGHWQIYFDAMKASGVTAKMVHQYYEPNRAKTLKFKTGFVPKTLERAQEILMASKRT